jgi:hypothetical protein
MVISERIQGRHPDDAEVDVRLTPAATRIRRRSAWHTTGCVQFTGHGPSLTAVSKRRAVGLPRQRPGNCRHTNGDAVQQSADTEQRARQDSGRTVRSTRPNPLPDFAQRLTGARTGRLFACARR